VAIAARRIGAETSATRAAILTATEALIRDEGYGAVSTRRVAARAGLKPSLVHYYFPTTDDLLIAVSRKGAAESDVQMEAALQSADPLRALWGYFKDSSRTAMALEFMALANRRPALREHMAEHSHEMRQRQVVVLERLLDETLKERCAPAGLSLVLAGVGRALVMEGSLGVTAGHEEAIAFVDQWIDQLLPPRDKIEAARA
jgi:AcrR family transcriptional regulator